MTTTARSFERRFDSVLAKFPLQLQEVFKCVTVIGINGNPFGPLRLGIQRVETDCHSPGEVIADGSECQTPVLFWTIIIVLAILGRPRRLQSMGKAIDEKSSIAA